MINNLDRFAILRRDNFTCAYCGCRPGNERLNVDHMVSVAWDGSDHEYNLVTACDKCNNGKSGRVAVPRQLCEGSVDYDGWVTWKRWGIWSLKWNPDADADDGRGDPLVLSAGEGVKEYWIPLHRFHEADWECHVGQKDWAKDEVFADFCRAIEFARTLVKPPKPSGVLSAGRLG